MLHPGGSAASPGIITHRQRIAVANPFPGHYVMAEAQIRVGNQWGRAAWASYDWMHGMFAGSGVAAAQLFPSGAVIIQAGRHSVAAQSDGGGSPFGEFNIFLNSAPYRLVVTRLGKIM